MTFRERALMLSAIGRRAWFGVGPLATVRATIKHLRRADPEAHRPASAPPQGPHPFDAALGVQTGGFVGWRDLQAGGANDPYISGYFGVVPSVARRLIAAVPAPADYVFIDIGCGKGRATIVASERPFRRVIGVEIAPALAEIARENARIVGARCPDRPAIEIACCDAAAFEFPAEPLVLFLYQPFERPVMRAVLARLQASLAAHPRPAVVLYVYPALAAMLDQAPWLEHRDDGVYDPAPEELPFSYGGRGGTERVAIWATRAPRPALARLETSHYMSCNLK
jgi:SAM-dependent methyltransferase